MVDKQVSREIFEAIMKEMVGTFRPSRDSVADDPFRDSSTTTPRSMQRPTMSTRYESSFESERYTRPAVPTRSPREEYRVIPESRRSSYGTPPARLSGEGVRSPYYEDTQRSRSPHRSDDYYLNNRAEGRDRAFAHPRDASWSDEREYRRPPRRADSFKKGDFSAQKRGYGRPDPPYISKSRQAYLERTQGPNMKKSRGESRGGGAERSQRGGVSPRGPSRGGVSPRGPSRGGVSPRGPSRGGVGGRGMSRGGVGGRGAAASQSNQRGGGATRGRGAFRGKTPQRGGFAQRGRRNQNQTPGKPGAVNGKKQGPKNKGGPFNQLMSGQDAFSKLGNKIVKWAGFNKRNSGEFESTNPAFATVQTQTVANALASFKCALKPELRYQCFLSVNTPNHAALKKPIVDADFLALLVEKGVVESKRKFADIINPLDKYLTSFQQCVLKSAHPLLLACNAYELNMKQGFPGTADLSNAYESAIALCRKSLVLFGQTFSIAGSLRQEKILEQVGLQDMAPKPTDFPNMEDSALFGEKYMTQLKAWLEKSGYPMHLEASVARKQKESNEDLTPEPQVKEMMDSLLESAVDLLKEKKRAEMEDTNMEESDQEKPELWYLFDETSQEFKYYHQKLAELRKLQQAEVDAKREQLKAAAAVSLAAKSGPSKPLTDPEFDEVDEKTRETAENLARFMIQLGSDIEDFNMESLTNNPDFWFFTEKDSAAHKFYQLKLAEFRESPDTEAKDGDPPTITEDSDEEHKYVEVDTQDLVEIDSIVMEVECETESTTKSAASALPQRKRGPQKATRAKVDVPVKTGNEKSTGRAGLRKKQKVTDEEHAPEDLPNRSTAASGDEDSMTGQQSNEESFGDPE